MKSILIGVTLAMMAFSSMLDASQESSAPQAVPLSIGPIKPHNLIPNTVRPSPVNEPKYAAWADSFSGQDSYAVWQDKRLSSIFRKSTPRIKGYFNSSKRDGLYPSMFANILADPIVVLKHRYLVITAYQAHGEGGQYSLWIDTKRETGIGAISYEYASAKSENRYTLLFSTAYTYKDIPSAFWESTCTPGIQTSSSGGLLQLSGGPIKFVGNDAVHHDITELVLDRLDSIDSHCDSELDLPTRTSPAAEKKP